MRRRGYMFEQSRNVQKSTGYNAKSSGLDSSLFTFISRHVSSPRVVVSGFFPTRSMDARCGTSLPLIALRNAHSDYAVVFRPSTKRRSEPGTSFCRHVQFGCRWILSGLGAVAVPYVREQSTSRLFLPSAGLPQV